MFLDVLVMIAMVYSIWQGITKGFFVSLASFLSIMIGTIAALKFSNVIKTYMYESMNWDSKFVPVLSFVLVFVLAVFLTTLIAKFVTKVFDAIMLGMLNRLLGVLFQVLLTAFIICVILSMFDEVNVNNMLASKETLEKSFSYTCYRGISENILPSLFQMVKHLFEKSVDVIKTTTPVSI